MKRTKLKPIKRNLNQLTNPTKSIFYYACFSRVLTLFIAFTAHLFINEYDNSSSIMVHNTLRSLLRFDAVHFLNITSHQLYPIENELAFFPLLPMITIVLRVVVSNVCFLMAAVVLFKLMRKLLNDDVIAFNTAILFCFTPSPGFMSSMYTESLFSLLSFGGIYYYINNELWLATILWSLSTFTRSNGLLFMGYIIYSYFFIDEWKQLSSIGVIIRLVKLSTQLLSIALGYLIFQYYAYQEYCSIDSPLSPWCYYKVPINYSYLQKHYWNNGFLKYYEWKQLPNFLLAMPFILISIYGIWEYIKVNKIRFFSLGLFKQNSETTKIGNNHPYLHNDQLLPHLYLWSFMLIYCIFFMHIQVIIRFFTSVPLFYGFIAYKISNNDNLIFKTIIIYYWCFYSIISTILFATFFPPA
ncbi:mannosyltransferase [Neoconidiobolus thromboides FSU 785]|nr:mannosyltransferase [Neoconidiobolus thromboides FSU 785]